VIIYYFLNMLTNNIDFANNDISFFPP